MMLAARELARTFFAGESDEARIVSADAFDDCASLGCLLYTSDAADEL